MRKTDPSTDGLDALSSDLLFSPNELSAITPGLWDTYLNPETICHVKEDNSVWMGMSREDSLPLTDNSGEEDDSTDSSWISREDDAILDKYTLALTMLEAQGEFSAMLLDEDFPGVLFQDDAVDALTLGGTALPPDLPLRPYRDIGQDPGQVAGQDSMQPIDYSLGSRLNDFLPVSPLDDIPELKPCPIATAENGKKSPESDQMEDCMHDTDPEMQPQQIVPIFSDYLITTSKTKRHRKTKRKIKDNKANIAPKKRTMPNADQSQNDTQSRDEDLTQRVIKREPEDQSTSDDDNLVINTENCCSNNPALTPNTKKGHKRPGRRPGQPSKVYHLWEFLRDLLLSADYCPTHVHWIDQMNGVFRIAKSEEVAQLWGQKKRTKRSMTYEKMSRAIRFSREAGYFGPLPKDGDYPKKLCFKFGPRAYDWIDRLNATTDRAVSTPKLAACKQETNNTDNKKTVHWKKRKVLVPT